MTTIAIPYRPSIDFCTTRCFSVQYGSQDKSLKCWQKVLIIALGILLVGIGGLALSYYWRDRLVQQLYDAEYQKTQELFKKTSFSVEEPTIPQALVSTTEIQTSSSPATGEPDLTVRVEKFRAEIEKGNPRMNNQTFAQLSGNGRYFIAIASITTNFQIPFSREELPEGIYCAYHATTARWRERLKGEPFVHYTRLCEEFGKDKVHLLAIEERVTAVDWAIRKNGLKDPDWYPEDGLILTLNEEINKKQIARFAQDHGS